LQRSNSKRNRDKITQGRKIRVRDAMTLSRRKNEKISQRELEAGTVVKKRETRFSPTWMQKDRRRGDGGMFGASLNLV